MPLSLTDLGRYERSGLCDRAGMEATTGSGSGDDDEMGAPRSLGGCGLEVGWAAPQLQGNWRSSTHHLRYLRERGREKGVRGVLRVKILGEGGY